MEPGRVREAAGGGAAELEARERIIAMANAEGFTLVRFAAATVLWEARAAAQARRTEGALADMAWMTSEWLDRSTDPAAFLAGARTVVLLALPCHSPDPEEAREDADGVARGRVARYARGRDYHRVFESKLRRIARLIREEFGAMARATVDYGPLLERPYAAASGLGWVGKSTMLLVPGFGPWVLLGAVVTTLELTADEPIRKSCGSCTRCVVACPTGALGSDGSVLDARLCISYHTIENRGPIPRELREKFGDWVFGCDDCLDSCPVGARTNETHPDFVAQTVEDARPDLVSLLALDEAAFRERFQGRAIMRAKRDGLVRNACVALGNVGTGGELPALVAALDDGSSLVRSHAAWAIAALLRRTKLDPREGTRPLEARLKVESDESVVLELRLALEELLVTPIDTDLRA